MGVWKTVKPFKYLQLPAEVRLMIKENIPDWDLRTHAALYLASPVTASLYDNTPDEFWKLVCWNSGIGLFPWEANKPDEEICWRDIALDCIRRDGFCKHPICGGRLLSYNREQMVHAESTGLIRPYEPACIRVNDEPDSDAKPKLTAHNIFEWIGFRPSTEVKDREFRLEYDAHLLPTAASQTERLLSHWDESGYDDELPLINDPMDVDAREYLARHPLAARSFATSIPVESISFCYVNDYDLKDQHWEPDHGETVTVTDVLGILQRELRHELDRDELETFARNHRQCLYEHGWGAYLTLRRMRTLRDTFSFCRLSLLPHICNEEEVGPAFDFKHI
ncbi:hypothetical protein K466DRAFT_596508 [Polyporus arcularius HHB13444]|uniref:Uncharacterized protein n=1 Tax=Polyporus arcularius HHB13444 TaxID=1314778 RepID=A0A5C3PR17_9APHY|nr:hypothetical protein K466DRAFT_596508 [Polyporus arcularius HHB13444]